MALTRDEVIDAALRFVDLRGLDALTMRALADEMGVYPTALYWHAGTKAQLVAAVSARVFDEVVLPDERELDWYEWLEAVARRCRESMHRHPNLAPIAGSQLVVATTAMPLVERTVATLERAGFSGEALVDAYNTYTGFILGWVTTELSAEPAEPSGAWKEEFAGQLRALGANAYPALRRNMPLLANNAFMLRWDSGRTRPLDRSFDVALTVLVRGLRELVA